MLKRDLESDRLYFRNRYYEKKQECCCKDEEIRILKKALELLCERIEPEKACRNCISSYNGPIMGYCGECLKRFYIKKAKESK